MELWKWQWRDPRIVGGVIPERAFRLVEGPFARTRTIGSSTRARGASSGLWYPRPPRLALHAAANGTQSRHKVNITTRRYLPAAATTEATGERNNRVVRRRTQHWVRLSCFCFRTSFRFAYFYRSTRAKHIYWIRLRPETRRFSIVTSKT